MKRMLRCLLFVLLALQAGCIIIEEPMFYDEQDGYAAPYPPAAQYISTAEPPRAGVPAVVNAASAPMQTQEPPR